MSIILNDLEVDLLLTAISRRYGYDFHDYAKASLHRRLANILSKYRLANLGDCQHRVINDPGFFYRMLNDLTITVSDLFRDPFVYQSLQKNVFPFLTSLSRFKVWHAGCANGEEVYSLAVLLKESGIYNKAVIYATDINKKAVEFARSGLFNKKVLEQGEKNYLRINSDGRLQQYYSSNQQYGVFNSSLRENVVFSRHNLVTDQSFGEMQLILCRNVLIYFNKKLQERVLTLLTNSLAVGGFLCLGAKETLRFSAVEDCYEVVDKEARIYRKVKEAVL